MQSVNINVNNNKLMSLQTETTKITIDGTINLHLSNSSTLDQVFITLKKYLSDADLLVFFRVKKLRLSDIEFNVATEITPKEFRDYKRGNQIPQKNVAVYHRQKRRKLFHLRQNSKFICCNFPLTHLHKVYYNFYFQVVIRIGIIPDASMNAPKSVRTNTVTHSTVPVHMGVEIKTL